MSLEIRKATEGDAGLIIGLIRGIAEYEKLTHQFVATEELIRKNMFGEIPYAHCYLAFVDGELAAYSLYFFNFSTFLAKPGLYLEDLFVKPEFRSQGDCKNWINFETPLCIQKTVVCCSCRYCWAL